MAPSFVTWPTRNVARPRPLACVMRRAAHSRTWATEPGADSRSGRKTVWIESTISAWGFTSSSAACTAARSVSAHSRSPSPAMPRRSARIFTCAADSSAQTYSTGGRAFASARAASNSNVDFPIPGSPPISTSEPRTTPPPSTRSSSAMPVGSRSPASRTTSLSGCGRLDEGAPGRRPRAGASARSSTSCTYAPAPRRQSGHVPGFGLAKPHSWQR